MRTAMTNRADCLNRYSVGVSHLSNGVSEVILTANVKYLLARKFLVHTVSLYPFNFSASFDMGFAVCVYAVYLYVRKICACVGSHNRKISACIRHGMVLNQLCVCESKQRTPLYIYFREMKMGKNSNRFL